MKNIGKIFTILVLLGVFAIGNAYLIYNYTKFEGYMRLCTFIVPPACIIMLGKAGKSLFTAWKGK